MEHILTQDKHQNRSNERNKIDQIQKSPIRTLKLATEELRRPHDEFPLPSQIVFVIIDRNSNLQVHNKKRIWYWYKMYYLEIPAKENGTTKSPWSAKIQRIGRLKTICKWNNQSEWHTNNLVVRYGKVVDRLSFSPFNEMICSSC